MFVGYEMHAPVCIETSTFFRLYVAEEGLACRSPQADWKMFYNVARDIL